MDTSNKQKFIFLFVISSIIITIIIGRNYKKIRIKRNMEIAIATIDDFYLYDRYLHNRLDYCFYSNQQVKKCSYIFMDNITLETGKKLVGKQTIVVYAGDNPQINFILLTTEQFSEYDISIPDSLKYITEISDK